MLFESMIFNLLPPPPSHRGVVLVFRAAGANARQTSSQSSPAPVRCARLGKYLRIDPLLQRVDTCRPGYELDRSKCPHAGRVKISSTPAPWRRPDRPRPQADRDRVQNCPNLDKGGDDLRSPSRGHAGQDARVIGQMGTQRSSCATVSFSAKVFGGSRRPRQPRQNSGFNVRDFSTPRASAAPPRRRSGSRVKKGSSWRADQGGRRSPSAEPALWKRNGGTDLKRQADRRRQRPIW